MTDFVRHGHGRRVLEAVSGATGIPLERLCGRERCVTVVRPRQAAYRMIREGGFSSTEIGRVVGDRDHSTVLHGIKRAEQLLKTDPEFANLYNACVARLER